VYVIEPHSVTSHSLVADFFHQEKGPLAFDLIDHLLREGRRVIVVGEVQMDASRNLKTLGNLFNLELTKFVLSSSLVSND
jgi:hypothetical protein